MEIYLKEAANKQSCLRFPSLPDKEITVKGNAKYQKYDLIKKGTFAFPAGPDIRSYEWSGYFWGRARKKWNINTKWLDPKSCIKKLENWRDKGTILNLVISAGGGINTDVTIQSFEYKKFGGKGDYSYSITFYRYRPLKIQTTKDLGIDKKKKKTTTRTNLKKTSTEKKKQTYTIKSGDCMWNIARKFYGSGADWKKIYNANKTTIEKAAKKYGHKDSDKGHWIFLALSLRYRKGGIMVDPLKYSYYLVLVTEKKKKYDITNFVEDLGWEELENELAARLSCTVKNDKTTKGRISSLSKPGCYLYLYYRYKTGTAQEAMRGRIVEWNPSAKSSSQPLKLKAYDNLYDLQESEDCVYYSSGARTKQVIQDYFKKWGIPIGKYTGPDVAHGVIKEDKKKLGTMVKDILDEARKNGGGYSIIRSVKGKAQILAIGSNKNIYHFAESENLISVSHKISTSGMVTRVKILGEANDAKRRPVEATVDGQTKYGVRQKILTRGKKDTLDKIKKEAKEVLEDDGKPKQEIKVVTIDIPIIRKGDIIHLKMSTGSGYYWVTAITHDCDKMEMTMSLKKTKLKSSSSNSKKKSSDYNVGDTVNFHGGYHYVSSDATSGYKVSAGKATITHSNPGSAHPWCLENVNWNETHVCGWVDEGSFD